MSTPPLKSNILNNILMNTIFLFKMLTRLHSKNCWVENNQIWVILVTQRWVKKGPTQRWVILTQPFGLLCLTQRWVILTQPFGLLCLTQQAGLLFYGLKLLQC